MSTIKEVEIQLTEERKLLSVIEVKIDNSLKSLSKRPETTLAKRSIQLAFMWLGKAKAAIGIANPYPHSKDPSNKTIEAAVDRSDIKTPDNGDDETLFCKSIRRDISDIVRAIDNDSQVLTINKKYQLCIANAYTHAEEAGMWMGVVLGNIRKEEEFALTADKKAKKPATKGPLEPAVEDNNDLKNIKQLTPPAADENGQKNRNENSSESSATKPEGDKNTTVNARRQGSNKAKSSGENTRKRSPKAG